MQPKEPRSDESESSLHVVIGYGFIFGRKDFQAKCSTNLCQEEMDLFQVFENIGANAYKVDLPSEYLVHNFFDVSDLSLFYVGAENSWKNSSK